MALSSPAPIIFILLNGVSSPLKGYAPAHNDENNEYYEGDDDDFSRPDSKRSTGRAGVGDKRAQIHDFIHL